ncbi:PIN domain-containing protein [Neobacillus sp. B4I6]|uniref:PIN domain-containing protein n=1 Tax=Neobacillus sp. B4I6 TaxID=3373925 RepID=UPI003D2088CF
MFQGFFKYTQEEFNELWRDAIFVVDTNVLISFFKYTTKDTYKTLFDILKDLKEKNRLFIPHQVALEYFHNYEGNMNRQKDGLNLLAGKLKKLKIEANKIFSTVESEHPYIINKNFKFILNDLEQSNKKIDEQLATEIESLPDVNEIQENILELMNCIIGEPYKQEMIDRIESIGKERYLNEVPPGWEDASEPKKHTFRTYGGIKYQQLYGDLIMWHQMMERANKDKDNPKPIIFITEEKKEDWWEKEGTAFKRPQPHLIQEFLEKTSQKFYMYRVDRFVKLAKQHLDADVSEEQIEQFTTQTEQIRKEDGQYEVDYRINVDINKVTEYLNSAEKVVLDQMFESAYSLDIDGPEANYKFNRAIEWAIKAALPRMESTLRGLAHELAPYNPANARGAIYTLENLPIRIDVKAKIILSSIEHVREKLDFYQGQGY